MSRHLRRCSITNELDHLSPWWRLTIPPCSGAAHRLVQIYHCKRARTVYRPTNFHLYSQGRSLLCQKVLRKVCQCMWSSVRRTGTSTQHFTQNSAIGPQLRYNSLHPKQLAEKYSFFLRSDSRTRIHSLRTWLIFKPQFVWPRQQERIRIPLNSLCLIFFL